MRPYRFRTPVEELRPGVRVAGRRGTAAQWVAHGTAALVAGSGAVNLWSLMGGPGPAVPPLWVQILFPLDFAGLTHTVTLITGFVLILVGFHLWGCKRRAWQMAMVMAGGSVAFHLGRGWNVREALSSTLLVGVLWLARRAFTVGSERPRLDVAAGRAGAAFLVATVYGTAGFWVLEPSQFHRNFHWWEAAVRTVKLLLFVGDGGLVPHTAYAAWYLDSLFWMSGAVIVYSGLTLFRPVLFRFRENWAEAARAESITARYGRSGLDFFKHAADKSYYFARNGESFVAYRVAGHYALALGDPVGPEEEHAGVVAEFRDYCRGRGWRVGFHQVPAEHLPVYEGLGFHRLKVGDDAMVDVRKFTLSGSAMKEFRNTVNRLDRLGYSVERVEPLLGTDLLGELRRISDGWLHMGGHRERKFTLGRFEDSYVRRTVVYVARNEEREAVAFLNLVPSYEPTLATVDLMRRGKENVNGLMDYLFAKTFLDLQGRGVEWFSMGMAPLSDVANPGTLSRDERIAYWVVKRMPFLFRADSLRRFKAKYADAWQPRYAVYESRLDLPRLALALRRVSELTENEARPGRMGEAA